MWLILLLTIPILIIAILTKIILDLLDDQDSKDYQIVMLRHQNKELKQKLSDFRLSTHTKTNEFKDE